MNEPARVVLVGNDPMSRLEQIEIMRHFWLIAAADSESYKDSLASSNVIVLCHSLSEKERHDVAEYVNHAHPQTLVVKINGYDSGPHAGLDASVDLQHGPAVLISTIYQLLTERGLPSKGWQSFELHGHASVV